MRVALLIVGMAIATVAATAADLSAQRVDAWVRSGSRGPGAAAEVAGPFSALIARSADLALSGDQVNRIRNIQRRLAREMEPLDAQIRDAEVWGATTEEEAAALAAVHAARREKAAAAEQELAEVLTLEQRERAAELDPDGALLLAYPEPEEPAVAIDEPEEKAAARAADEPRVTILVENRNYYNATVYVYAGAQRQRLGDVTGLMSRSFTLPRNLMTGTSGLRFEVRLLARRDSRMSNPVLVNAGDEVYVRISPT